MSCHGDNTEHKHNLSTHWYTEFTGSVRHVLHSEGTMQLILRVKGFMSRRHHPQRPQIFTKCLLPGIEEGYSLCKDEMKL